MQHKNITQLIAVSFCIIFFFACHKKNSAGEKDELKPAGNTLMETGELVAVNSKAFVLPRFGQWNEMQVIGILKQGTIVHKGDSIIQLDPTDVKKYIVDRETELETQLAAKQKLLVDQDNAINSLVSDYKIGKATFDLKKIALDASRFESERFKKIKELEYEQEKIRMALDERKIELNKIVNSNDLKIQEVRLNQIRRQIKNGYSILENLTIRTPYEGVFQIAWNYRTRALLKESDYIYAGNNLARVPDLEWMKVTTFINENDFLKIYPGQKVAVRLDAMPNVSFDGKVTYIGKLCYIKDSDSRQKVFDVEVTILKSDRRLKPGMTVSCEYLNCK